MGFLARGGLVLFALPIVVLPTPIGISIFLGGTALTGSGASDGLILLIVAGVLLVMGLVAAGLVIEAFADVVLGREAATFARDRAGEAAPGRRHPEPVAAGWAVTGTLDRDHQPVEPGFSSMLGRLVILRAMTLVPIAFAVAWATSRLVAAAYHQLILPDDLTIPLAVRILVEAVDAAVVVVVVWLVAELFGGIVVRHVILGGRSAAGAAAAAIRQVARRPLTAVVTFILGVLGLVITAGPLLLLAAALWSRLQALLADDAPAVQLLPATFVFVLVWAGGLVVVGTVVTWRGLLGSLDLLRAMPGFSAPVERQGLRAQAATFEER